MDNINNNTPKKPLPPKPAGISAPNSPKPMPPKAFNPSSTTKPSMAKPSVPPSQMHTAGPNGANVPPAPKSSLNAPQPKSPKVPLPKKPTSTLKRASTNKEEELKEFMATVKPEDRELTREDKKLLDEQANANYNIDKKKNKINQPIKYQDNANLKASKNHPSLNKKFYGSSFAGVNKARKKALYANKKMFSRKKRRRALWLNLLLVFLIFAFLVAGTYLLVNVIVENTKTITDKDIQILDTATEADFEVFSDPVTDYSFGLEGGIERGIRVSNKSTGIGVYLAFSMKITEIFPDEPNRPEEPIDLTGVPIYSTTENQMWISNEKNGTTYYYYKKILFANSQATLFRAYDLILGSTLTESELSQRTVRITVTIEILQEGSSNIGNSSREVWSSAPTSWTSLETIKK